MPDESDAGMFEPNLRDERLLPFEGHGAVSTWRVTLPARHRGFDYHTITDVVLHLRYTARDGGEGLAGTVSDSLDLMLADAQSTALRPMVSLRHEFPAEWGRFINPAANTGDQELVFDIADRFPLMFSAADSTITVTGVDAYVQATGDDLRVLLTHRNDVDPQPLDLTALTELSTGGIGDLTVAPGPWTLRIWREVPSAGGPIHERLNAGDIHEIVLVFHYTVSRPS